MHLRPPRYILLSTEPLDAIPKLQERIMAVIRELLDLRYDIRVRRCRIQVSNCGQNLAVPFEFRCGTSNLAFRFLDGFERLDSRHNQADETAEITDTEPKRHCCREPGSGCWVRVK